MLGGTGGGSCWSAWSGVPTRRRCGSGSRSGARAWTQRPLPSASLRDGHKSGLQRPHPGGPAASPSTGSQRYRIRSILLERFVDAPPPASAVPAIARRTGLTSVGLRARQAGRLRDTQGGAGRGFEGQGAVREGGAPVEPIPAMAWCLVKSNWVVSSTARTRPRPAAQRATARGAGAVGRIALNMDSFGRSPQACRARRRRWTDADAHARTLTE